MFHKRDIALCHPCYSKVLVKRIDSLTQSDCSQSSRAKDLRHQTNRNVDPRQLDVSVRFDPNTCSLRRNPWMMYHQTSPFHGTPRPQQLV